MKDLTIIIVNYNVRHFLEQCLLSVQEAIRDIDAEVYVVDNNSVDGSQQMVRERFPWVIQIENKDNTGFSKANNQAIALAEGKYVLLLNPDTVVEPTTFTKVIDFMDAHPDAGALGVKMFDGKGKFLPESKRGLPTPWVAFYKIFGISKLFKKSKKFNRYHLGYLDMDENHEVEVLSGAFMLLRKDVLEEIGYLDETFFMYGEDIDLSYRVIKGGYKNYYFAETKIIHYKGESTKKGSLNYVKVFYNAMIIFAKKHFSSNRATFFTVLIRLAVYFRAVVAAFNRIIKRIAFPLIEAILIFLAIIGVKEYWEHYVKFIKGGLAYPWQFDAIAAPIYTLVFILLLWVAGAYKKPLRFKPILTACFSGFVAIATVSYIFPEINFSRAIVGLSSIFTVFIALLNRGIINFLDTGNFFFTEESKKRLLVVGDKDEANRISRMIRQELDYPVDIVGIATITEQKEDPSGQEIIGTLDQIRELIPYYKIEEVVFANKSLATDRIIDLMAEIEGNEVDYKIVPPQADYLIGPQVIHSSFSEKAALYNLQRKELLFQKRVFDILGSLSLLILYPLTWFLYRRPGLALKNLVNVLFGKYHLVGYIKPDQPGLPRIKRGVLNMLHRVKRKKTGLPDHLTGLDRHYARSYSWELDLEIMLKGFRSIGE